MAARHHDTCFLIPGSKFYDRMTRVVKKNDCVNEDKKYVAIMRILPGLARKSYRPPQTYQSKLYHQDCIVFPTEVVLMRVGINLPHPAPLSQATTGYTVQCYRRFPHPLRVILPGRINPLILNQVLVPPPQYDQVQGWVLGRLLTGA